ncbi:thermonuclease family protein [Tsukamurella hominis]|uniref:thermonuclease family protein n=1 Tax=Tsukamurella hominis TaxID=1970232 RepID=UPI0039E9E886
MNRTTKPAGRSVITAAVFLSLVALLIIAVGAAARAASPDRGRPTATAPTRPASGLDGPYRVTAVVDGDTIRVARENGGGAVTIRLLGVDAPETKDRRTSIQCYGPEASAHLQQTLAGRTVDLEYGYEKRDRYGRTLAYVWSGPILINYELVAGGWAREFTYARPTAHTAALRAAQGAARADGYGLWAPAGCNGVTDKAGA